MLLSKSFLLSLAFLATTMPLTAEAIRGASHRRLNGRSRRLKEKGMGKGGDEIEEGAPAVDPVEGLDTRVEDLPTMTPTPKPGKGKGKEADPIDGLDTRIEDTSEPKGKGKGASVKDSSEGAAFLTINATWPVEAGPDFNAFPDNTEAPGNIAPLNLTESAAAVYQIQTNSSCISYVPGDVVTVADCDAAGASALWEFVELQDSALFQMRHFDTGLCIPENPESPAQAFDCWADQTSQAIGDTINGLVDCLSPFAAIMGFLDSGSPYLFNSVCSTGEVGSRDVILMAYTTSTSSQVLWGEKILLGMDVAREINPYELSADWDFVEVDIDTGL